MRRLPACRLLAGAIAVAASSEPLGAQTNPSERAAAFFDALAARRWRDAAAMVHPDRRAAMQDEEMAVIVGWALHRDDVNSLRDTTSSGGLATAWRDWGRWREELATVGHLSLPGFGDATTIRAVAGLPPLEFVAHFIAASAFDPDPTGPRPAAEHLTRRIVGTVVEGSGVAHVLYRLEGRAVEPTDPHEVQLLRLRRRGNEWFVWPLSHNLDIASGTYLRFDILGDDSPPDPE